MTQILTKSPGISKYINPNKTSLNTWMKSATNSPKMDNSEKTGLKLTTNHTKN